MLSLKPQELANILDGALLRPSNGDSRSITSISTDARLLHAGAAFFALRGTRTDGHRFVGQALGNGAELAVVSRNWAKEAPGDLGSLISVEDPLAALQRLAKWWRSQYNGDIVAITGSNGKTIVKECLYQILSRVTNAYHSPGSYNSQLGVPLSMLGMPLDSSTALFEIGVSEPGEMSRLTAIVQPKHGILTNIGWAHISSFGAQEAIAAEKVKLFDGIGEDGWAILPPDLDRFGIDLGSFRCPVYQYGVKSDRIPFVEKREIRAGNLMLSVAFPGGERHVIPVDTISLEISEDIEIALTAAYLLGASPEDIAEALRAYVPSPTRMEVWRSPSGVTLINDSYDADLLSVQAALHTMSSYASPGAKRYFVFGGMPETSTVEQDQNRQIGKLAATNQVDQLLLVGNHRYDSLLDAFREEGKGEISQFAAISEVGETLAPKLNTGDVVLVKGQRLADIGKVATDLIGAMAPNRYIIDLRAIQENVGRFRKLVGPRTSIMAMVKASAYGAEAPRIASELQAFGVDAFGVASVDEGIALRRSGITSQIVVMLTTPGEAEKLVSANVTPLIYSFDLVEPLATAARKAGKQLPVHLEVDTGMGRTGVFPSDAVKLAKAVSATGSLSVSGLMTHFSSADEPGQDSWTRQQIEAFEKVTEELRAAGFLELTRHAAATAATIRFPEAHFDMVRIGLGLYGLYPSGAVSDELGLVLAVSLVSRIARIQEYRPGDHIGYGGTYVVEREGFRGAVIPLGYDDGLPRNLSNNGTVSIDGKLAPIVGRISMDSMTVDVSEIPSAKEGMDVLIFGNHAGHVRRPEALAEEANTIPYELMVRIGPRVQRIYLGA